jgi:hypothetical protein
MPAVSSAEEVRKMRSPYDRISKIASDSRDAWEMAVETAGPEYCGGSDERAAEMQKLADACDDAYDRAIDAVTDEDMVAALEALEEARSLESEGGDCSHARSAIEIVAEEVSP